MNICRGSGSLPEPSPSTFSLRSAWKTRAGKPPTSNLNRAGASGPPAVQGAYNEGGDVSGVGCPLFQPPGTPSPDPSPTSVSQRRPREGALLGVYVLARKINLLNCPYFFNINLAWCLFPFSCRQPLLYTTYHLQYFLVYLSDLNAQLRIFPKIVRRLYLIYVYILR